MTKEKKQTKAPPVTIVLTEVESLMFENMRAADKQTAANLNILQSEAKRLEGRADALTKQSEEAWEVFEASKAEWLERQGRTIAALSAAHLSDGKTIPTGAILGTLPNGRVTLGWHEEKATVKRQAKTKKKRKVTKKAAAKKKADRKSA